MIKTIRITVIFLLFYGSLYSQKKIAATELKKSRDAYLSAENFSADVKVVSFKTADQQVGKPLGTGIIRKSKNGYYSKYLDDEMISNEHCTVVVDYSTRDITYLESATSYFSESLKKIMPSADSLFKRADSVVFKGTENGVEHFLFTTKKSVIRRIDMYLGVKDHFIKKLVYQYAPSDRQNDYGVYKVEITYENIKLSKIDKTWFSENKILSYKKGKPILQLAYNSYKLNIAEPYKDHPLK